MKHLFTHLFIHSLNKLDKSINKPMAYFYFYPIYFTFQQHLSWVLLTRFFLKVSCKMFEASIPSSRFRFGFFTTGVQKWMLEGIEVVDRKSKPMSVG